MDKAGRHGVRGHLLLMTHRHGLRVSAAVGLAATSWTSTAPGCGCAGQGHDLRLIRDGHRDPRHIVHHTRTTGRRFEGLWR